jgi:peptide/nickel transport system permease protein
MFKYIARRILFLLPVLVGVSFIVFSLLYITPGDPARMVLGDQATEEAVQEFRNKEGLNDPFLVQYGRYVYKALQGDIGRSYMTRRPVSDEILSAFPSTIKLAALSMVIRQYSLFDSVTMIFAMVGLSMPVFWLGILLILFFSVQLRWLPSSGFDSLAAMILPSITLAAQSVAIVTRMTRSSMLEVVRQDYIRTARAKGQKESVGIWRHALGNALIPVVTVVGLQFGHLLGGAVLTESIFSIPGWDGLWWRPSRCGTTPWSRGRSVHRHRLQSGQPAGGPGLCLGRSPDQGAVQMRVPHTVRRNSHE